ncbi:MAG: integrase [Bacteriovoracia bacterium]
MPNGVKRILLQKLKLRYLKGSRRQKTLILDEFCATTELSRKHAIRLLNNEIKSHREHPGPKYKYGEDVRRHVVILWESCGRLCSKKMVGAIKLWLPYYEGISDETRFLLTKVSSSTIDRILRGHRELVAKGRSLTSPSLIKNKIPIKLLEAGIVEPGFVEADTVAHCGTSMAGEFVNTLTVTDIFSGWTELRAVWGKRAEAVLDAVKGIETTLPFKVKGFASDNGNEFLNNDLFTYFDKRPEKVHFVRRRPYKKNDNAHVEQKNWTHVRQLLGYDRLDLQWDVDYINDMYVNYWLPLWNFFTPVMKLKSKTRVGGRIVKVHDEPQTPFARIINCEHVSQEQKQALLARRQHLNPFRLKAELEKKLKWFFRIVDIRKKQSREVGS